MAELSAQEKIALIKENLQEVLREDIIEDVIVKQNRPLVIYLGMWHKPCARVPQHRRKHLSRAVE